LTKRLILALPTLAVVAAAPACSSSGSMPTPAVTTSPSPHPSAAQTSVSLSDFRSMDCSLLGPGENDDPRLVFEVELQVNSGIAVTVNSFTIQWHRRSVTGPVIATETDPVGPGERTVARGLAWAFAWPNTSGLTVSRNGAAGPDPVACTVAAISGASTTTGSG
jgi:hypothetical protein